MNYAPSIVIDKAAKNVDWQNLIRKAQNGDDEAVGQMVSQVYQYLMHIVRGEQSPRFQSKFGASDIVQQSMFEAHQSFQKFNGCSEVELRSWMKKIVLNNLIDSTRTFCNTASRDVTREVPIEALSKPLVNTSHSPSWLMKRRESDENLLLALHSLPDQQRIVIEARHRHGHSYRQIAADIGITETTARKLWSRGIQNLKEILS